jgi:3-dehydroquinate dehydratase II
MPVKILLVNGPNLNTLGSRQPELYGRETLPQIETRCKAAAKAHKMELDCLQSNHEGDIVTAIQEAGKKYQGIIINAGAYSHSSIAIMDALLLHTMPIIEVHLSNIFQREDFRHHSYISRVARGVICGLGSQGYLLAIDAMSGLVKLK